MVMMNALKNIRKKLIWTIVVCAGASNIPASTQAQESSTARQANSQVASETAQVVAQTPPSTQSESDVVCRGSKRLTFPTVREPEVDYKASAEELIYFHKHAALSEAIYRCAGACTEFNTRDGAWEVLVDSRSVNPGLLYPAGRGTRMGSDPEGFHAVAVRASGSDRIVIVYEGTDWKSWRDWSNNFSLPYWKPQQLDIAVKFFDIVKNSFCVNSRCAITAVGHSLGGALAQYVALERNTNALVFNAAGLANPLLRNSQAFFGHADIRHVFSRGWRLGNRYGKDYVPQVAGYASQTLCVAPVQLPGWTWDIATTEVATHSISRLTSGLSGILQVTAENQLLGHWRGSTDTVRGVFGSDLHIKLIDQQSFSGTFTMTSEKLGAKAIISIKGVRDERYLQVTGTEFLFKSTDPNIAFCLASMSLLLKQQSESVILQGSWSHQDGKDGCPKGRTGRVYLKRASQ